MRRCAGELKEDCELKSIAIIYMGKMCEQNGTLDLAEEYYKLSLKIAVKEKINYIHEYVKQQLRVVWDKQSQISRSDNDKAEFVRVIQSELGIMDTIYGEFSKEYLSV